MTMILGGSRVVRRARMTAFILSVACLLAENVVAQMPHAASEREAGNHLVRAAVLRAEIARHDELYFKKATPEISDEAYDRLKRELAECERTGGLDSAVSERVGDDRDGRFPVAQHGVRMLSLQKVYTDQELETFVKRVRAGVGEKTSWVLEPKYDGLAISATYENGRLVRVVTRGNGGEGDNVTENARAIRAFPTSLRGTDWPERIELRGEVCAAFGEFERVNAERLAAGEIAFANPRALAAGSLKLMDPCEVATRGLSVVFYGWGEVSPSRLRPVTQRAFHEQIKAWGLPGVSGVRHARTEAELRQHVRAFARERARLPFPTDGVVIKLDDVAQQDALGMTDQAPRWAVAFKFSAQRVETRLKAITIQVGRTGALTPVAELEPVLLGGSTVARATLHNAGVIAARDVRVGDVVFVEKAGEIIPDVVAVDRTQRTANNVPFVFPGECPVCRTLAVPRTEEAGILYCPNRDCVAQVKARLRHFTGPQAVAITGLGETTIEELVTARGVKSPAQLYRFTREDWLGVPGVGKRTADKLLKAVEAGKRAELWRYIYGLGIPGVGISGARSLANHFPTLDALAGAQRKELLTVVGIGAAQTGAIELFFADPQNRVLVAELQSAGVEPVRSTSVSLPTRN
jgi:DNA ligase (NAD+)